MVLIALNRGTAIQDVKEQLSLLVLKPRKAPEALGALPRKSGEMRNESQFKRKVQAWDQKEWIV